MSKEKKLSEKAKELNDKLLELSKTTKTKPKRIKNKDTIQFLSPNASIYKNSATIILRGKPIKNKESKETKFLEFLSRAPISFDDEE